MNPLFFSGILHRISAALQRIICGREDHLKEIPRNENSKIILEVHLFNHSHTDDLRVLVAQGVKIMALLDALAAQVTKNAEVDDSAIVLLQGLKTKLDQAIQSGDPAALQLLSDQLAASTQKLADAVVANTPAADPAPTP